MKIVLDEAEVLQLVLETLQLNDGSGQPHYALPWGMTFGGHLDARLVTANDGKFVGVEVYQKSEQVKKTRK